MNIASETIIERVKGASKDEQRLMVKALPTKMLLDEIARREEQTTIILNDVKAIMSGMREDMDLIEMKDFINELKSALNPKTHKTKEIIFGKENDVQEERDN